MNALAVIQLFQTERIVTVALLATWLSCSIPTARRRLKEWSAYTSYNHNGCYYTLPKVAHFDRHGLWRYKGAFFSKHGNLKQTAVYLISHSECGLSGRELGELLGLQPRSFLAPFRTHPKLYRERQAGRWIWFSADPGVRQNQKRNRAAQVAADASQMPSDMEAVMILVDLIHHPNSRLERIAYRLEQKGWVVEVETIRRLLVHHDVLKKTVGSPSSAT